MSSGEPLRTAPWEATVTVREDRELEEELVGRWERGSGQRSVGVTDLIALRRAFFRRVAPPVELLPARQARLDEGRFLHRTLGSRLASEGLLEARVRRDGIVGRIDILADLPVELKTASSIVAPAELRSQRPDHLEQLGMYCALVDRSSGRLVTLVVEENVVKDVQSVQVRFGATDRILDEMRRRASALGKALAERKADRLPRCPWFGRGCEFEAASVCGCTGQEASVSLPISEEVEALTPRDDIGHRLRSALSEPIPFPAEMPIERYRELLYPRRAYFDRTTPPVPMPESPKPVTEPDLFSRLTEAVEGGPAGEVARLPARSVELEEEVVGFRGQPMLTRTSRAWSRYRSEELLSRAPQYALELGFRCAATGTASGWVILGFERAETDRERIQALELRFASLTPFSRLYRERIEAMERALRDRSPGGLPACPEWMVKDCPYRVECGCGEASSPRTMR